MIKKYCGDCPDISESDKYNLASCPKYKCFNLRAEKDENNNYLFLCCDECLLEQKKANRTRQDIFKPELDLLSPNYREFISLSLDILPEYFFHIPASSSGKYHPQYALGEAGLVRHTKVAVHWANILLGLKQYQEQDINRDIIISALILHDGFKSDINNIGKTLTNHPQLCADILDEAWTNMKEFINYQKLPKHRIIECICSHMGQWNTDKDDSSVNLPFPETDEEKFVHLCDYLASRRFCEVKFDEMDNIIL